MQCPLAEWLLSAKSRSQDIATFATQKLRPESGQSSEMKERLFSMEEDVNGQL